MLQILELFGGIGSPRVALRNLGVDVKAIDYVEIDEKAVRSYNAMFEKELAYRTQSVVNYNLKPDILIHGSPCQSFSIAGKQEGADEGSGTESSLMWETINIIKQMEAWKPKVVIWENVKNVLSKHMKHNFNKYLDEMQKLGYTNNYEVLNAMDFGLPQNRNRVFTISCLDGTLFNFKTLEKYPMRNIKEFLQNDVSEEYEVTQPSILKGIGTKGVNRATIIKDYAYTITERQDRCPAQVIDLGNGKYRFLTDLECWRLQGYKDNDYYSAAKVNTKRALYKQAGNSIPVTIFESIFKQLLFCNMKGVQYETNTF
nr:MAG TPA: Cytosine specific methyltransferase [Caudoviricetes sp.]